MPECHPCSSLPIFIAHVYRRQEAIQEEEGRSNKQSSLTIEGCSVLSLITLATFGHLGSHP